MSKPISFLAVLLAGALGAVLFFWRRSEGSWSSMWGAVKTSTASWTDGAVGDAATEVSRFADGLKDAASQAANQAGGAADSVAAAGSDATDIASSLVDDVRGAGK
jgi:hypothetical protein